MTASTASVPRAATAPGRFEKNRCSSSKPALTADRASSDSPMDHGATLKSCCTWPDGRQLAGISAGASTHARSTGLVTPSPVMKSKKIRPAASFTGDRGGLDMALAPRNCRHFPVVAPDTEYRWRTWVCTGQFAGTPVSTAFSDRARTIRNSAHRRSARDCAHDRAVGHYRKTLPSALTP